MNHMQVEAIEEKNDTDWQRDIGHHVLKTGFGVKNPEDRAEDLIGANEASAEQEFTD